MPRLAQLDAWLAETLPGRRFQLTPASADASFRRYFRLVFDDGSPSLIVMDAPPANEDCRPWLHVADLFRKAGAHVPDVLAQDLEQGFLLLSDLGSTTYLSALRAQDDPYRAAGLYADALGTLAAIQAASRPGVLPDYDRALLLRELMLFPEWYVARHKGIVLDDKETASLHDAFERILAVNLAEPRVFVHRDFHSRNLMLLAPADEASPGAGPNPGVIDFQDAVYGPISYDLVSLFKDAYIRWDEEFILDLLIRYWETAKKLGLPVREAFADFHRDFEWMGVQRHLKVLGIFARLLHRDGKPRYAADAPRFVGYLDAVLPRYPELDPLRDLIDRYVRPALAG
ncbi:MAG: phosphotransferase [Thauera phenolivorans]|uniref:Phosphotransferase n=1 Tax=Thauera phenolivorans TaxID=1792543 RepID=A0A7X7LXA7_9RHOO|nr:phosphotransferase [Thauera phenolivorans]